MGRKYPSRPTRFLSLCLPTTDQYPNNVNKQDIDRVLARGRSETGGLDYELHLKETARVMLTADIDISDRLINTQIL